MTKIRAEVVSHGHVYQFSCYQDVDVRSDRNQ